MTSLWAQTLLGALFLPFLLQTALVVAGREMGFVSNDWLMSGLIPTVLGFIVLERRLRLYAALVSLAYVPLMLGAMFLWVFGVIAWVYGDGL